MEDAAAQTTAEPVSARRINWRLVRLAAAVLGLTIASTVTVAVSPFITGAILDQRVLPDGGRLTDFQAGQIRTAEILTYALLCIFISARIRLVEPRVLGAFGLVLVIAGNLGATLGTGLWDIVAMRMVHALGLACAVSAGGALLVLAPNPQRVSGGLLLPALAIAMGAVYFASQLAMVKLSQAGAFGAVAIAACIGLVLVLTFAPKGRSNSTTQPAFSSMLGALRSPYVIACAVVFFGSTAVWQSFRQIGLTHGLDAGGVGILIIAAQVSGALIGASMALVKGAWLRPVALVATVVFGVMTILVPLAQNQTMFISAYAGLTVSYLCVTVLLAAIGARLDRTGGLNAAGLGWQALVNALSPYAGGAIVTHGGGYSALFILAAISATLALPALIFATRSLPTVEPAPGPVER